MILTTKPSTANINQSYSVTLNKQDLEAVLALSSSDSYWLDETVTWESVDFVYENNGQILKFSFDTVGSVNTISTPFKFPIGSRTGTFTCKKIIINGNVADSYVIKRSMFTNQTEFDIIVA
jgi:hypothetical protein